MESTQIPRLELPSGDGNYVEFVDLDDLTGADLHALRKTIRAEDSAGQTTNALMVEAMRVGIKTWRVGYLIDERTPEANPAAWKKLKARDLQAIESALQPLLALMRPPTAPDLDDTPGSPTPPDSD